MRDLIKLEYFMIRTVILCILLGAFLDRSCPSLRKNMLLEFKPVSLLFSLIMNIFIF